MAADVNVIKARMRLYQQIREFFAERHVCEVETPLLSAATIPDANIHSLSTSWYGQTYYLQTSPEFHMKRLLAQGSGSIFQITKAFREDETSSLHNPEFSMLEWYRVHFDHHDLMDEVDALLQTILTTHSAQRWCYQECFEYFLQLDPLQATIEQLKQCAVEMGVSTIGLQDADRDTWLQLLMHYGIEPSLNELEQPCFIYDFPASQAALAKLSPDDPRLAQRFEVFYQGMELANGFHELIDAEEQYQRFVADNQRRQERGLATVPIDQSFIQALQHGIPSCAGIALGVDRLLMLQLAETDIGNVISFPWQEA